jgi:hypothetical protein
MQQPLVWQQWLLSFESTVKRAVRSTGTIFEAKKSPQTLRLAGLNPIQGELEETGSL